MRAEVIQGVFLPFAGTVLGAACVFFMRGALHAGIRRALTGFAAGVMVAASVWSLLVPAMEQASDMGKFAFQRRLDSGWASCFCWFWIGSFPICTRIAASRRAFTPG